MAKTDLTLRALNRATLARQMLLAREHCSVVDAAERLAGLQAQLARPPFVGLWTRVEGFSREDLLRSIQKRDLVRATMMRCTIHLCSTADYRRWRRPLQPALDKALRSALGDRLKALDLPAVVKDATRFFSEPRTFDDLRKRMQAEQPDADERAVAYAARCHVPLVLVPDETADWGYAGNADFTLASSWIEEPLEKTSNAADIVLRYLAAFGPATLADAQSWSGLPGLAPVFEELRPKLKMMRDERGRELFDLPRAPRPDPDVPAPVRFLPEFDNLLLGHDDRRRVIADEHKQAVARAPLLLPVFLVDGFVAGTWKSTRKKKTAVLEVKPFDRISKKTREELTAEGDGLLRFLEGDEPQREIKFV